MPLIRSVLNTSSTARVEILQQLEASDFVEYAKHHLWLPVIIGIVGVALVLLLVWFICCCRRCSHYDYSAIKDDISIKQKLEGERRIRKTAARDAMLLSCYYYLKDSDKYRMINQLAEIGSRVNKHWFLVSDSKTKTDTMLAVLPWNAQCILPFNRLTRKTLSDLFTLLQFPYIFPITDIDLVFEHQLVVIMQPFKSSGSLKDLIYGHKPLVAWEKKYQNRKKKGLSLSLIRNYGRQILEALMYLRDKGLPTCTHLHSGNVFIVNKVCKLSGYEMALLGFTPRIHPLIKKAVKKNKDLAEVISFGHVLFEMAFGYELTSLEPDTNQLVSCPSSEVTEVLNYIFLNESGQYPTIEEVSSHKFFEKADLSASRNHNPGPVRFSSGVRALLKLYRKEGDNGGRSRRSSTRQKRGESIDLAQPKKERKSSRTKGKRSNSQTSSNATTPIVSPHNGQIFSPTPPRPPVHALPPPSVATVQPPTSSKRGALLSDIRKGARLKKTVTNDRSTPRV